MKPSTSSEQLSNLVMSVCSHIDMTSVSAVKGPRYIDTRVLSFLESCESKLLKMSEVDFKVAALRKLAKQELIAFFNKHIRIGAPKRKVLSVRVYGSKHSSNFEVDNNEAVGPNTVRIDDIFSFRASQPLYGSHRRGYEHMEVHNNSK
ncbi:insulin-degrading enzyme-like 1, peroxisomal [Eucalyptus grandis]|uniref:insulin-degrading enzyme-like 1, peroxisomal n=1 Tax=Eucalyptus grandis TaxID=71139 RepID=UPI00192EFD08|nr:insulin-degrading enzyme-like 1, peroxisomal [Eucalyptus grandis]XP_039168472.1 insulin-degrading enzyme-like 1, peroxisomal [Eucalyptus grandis]XP_039168473.1 insulin-degrading enzyme-like 1, peroxisomal [Eucalyptus grandis]